MATIGLNLHLNQILAVTPAMIRDLQFCMMLFTLKPKT